MTSRREPRSDGDGAGALIQRVTSGPERSIAVAGGRRKTVAGPGPQASCWPRDRASTLPAPMSLASRHCLVVGGTGFIGRRIVERFAREGAFVEGWGRTAGPPHATHGPTLDRALGTSSSGGTRVTWRAVDLLGKDLLPEPPRGGWDLVVHLAGHSRPRHFDSHADVLDTVRMMARVLRHLDRVSPGCRFILNSSGFVYSPAVSPHVETDPTHPLGHYALSKLLCEEIALLHRERLDVTIVRAFNLLGPGMPDGLLVTDFMRRLDRLPAQGGPLDRIVMAGRNSWRDFLDIRDAVDAYCAFAELQCESGSIFNLCSGRPTRVAELLGTILGVLGLDLAVEFQDPTEEHLLGDPTRLCDATGWAPEHSLVDIVDSLVEARRG
jgi:GDP-4-dehydro-6-deoxy-D-mannose reductase